MPQRNLIILLITVTLAYACYLRAEQNPYARYVSTSYETIDRWALDDVPDDQLFSGAMQGMIDVLRRRGDEHSQFIAEEDTELFQAEMRQQFGGIGVRIRQTGDPPLLTVAGPPEPGTPAFRADVRPNDQIVAIDGQPTDGLTMTEVLRLMRGDPGEPVRLSILHPGEEDPVTIVLVREVITIDSILGDRRLPDGTWRYRLDADPRIAYIRITIFADRTVAELTELVERLEQQGVEALVLDLRDNSGGALDAAVDVCDLFLPAGKLIVETRGRDRQLHDRFVTSGAGAHRQMPMAVLINRNSASASEIVAACLQDHGRAAVVGERSFGKGTVQQLIRVEAGRSRLKLTSASYWRPSGDNIHRMPGDTQDDMWGVLPSPGLEVELDDEDYAAYRQYRSERDLLSVDEDEQADEAGQEDAEELVDQALLVAVEHLQQQLPSVAPAE